MVGHTVKHFVAGPTPSLWDDINSSIQKLDPMHVDVSNSCYSPGPGGHKFRDPDYRGDPEVCGDEGIKSEPMYLGEGEGYVNDAYNQVTICWNMLQHGQELKTSSQLDVVTLQMLYLLASQFDDNVLSRACLSLHQEEERPGEGRRTRTPSATPPPPTQLTRPSFPIALSWNTIQVVQQNKSLGS